LNSNNWFANSRHLKRPVSQANNFGGSFGGKLIEDSLYFFTAYEGLQLRQGNFALTDVPSLTARQNVPLSVRPLLNAFPLPNSAARNDGFAEFASTFTTPATANSASLRLDYQNNKLQLNGRYHYSNSYATTRGDEGFSLNTLKRTDNQIQTFTGKVNYSLTSSFVFDSSVNYSRVNLGQSFHTDNFGGANVAQNLFGNDLSTYDLYGRNAAIASSGKISGKIEQFNFTGSGHYIFDTHLIDFGFDIRRLSLTSNAQPNERSILFSGINGALSGLTARTNFFSRIGTQESVINKFTAFAQDDWRVTPNLSLKFGLLWESNKPLSSDGNQTPLALTNTNTPFGFATNSEQLWKPTYNNFAPRISVAYNMDNSGKNVIRAGLGWFYDNANINAPEIYGHSFPFTNGTVSFNQPFASPNQNQTINNSFIGYAPDLKLPFVRRWSISFMREISRSTSITATYEASQGRRLLLTNTLLNQDAQFAFVRLTTNEGESDYKAFRVRFQKSSFKHFSFLFNYNITKSLDNYSPDSLAKSIIATPQQDRSFSDFDIRHSVNGYVTYSTPNEFSNKFVKGLLSDWSITSFFNFRTALPVNVVYGRVNNFGISYLRPDVIQRATEINSSSFAIPTTQSQGNLARNSFRSFPFYQVDLGASRKIKFTQDVNLTFRVGVTNLFNHPNFAAPSAFDLSLGTLFPNGVYLSNSTFGQPSSLASTAGEREIGPRMFSAYQPNASRSLVFSMKFSF